VESGSRFSFYEFQFDQYLTRDNLWKSFVDYCTTWEVNCVSRILESFQMGQPRGDSS
jgi:hypothetical protein